MKDVISDIWMGMFTPSTKNESAYEYLTIAISHIMVGASAAFIFSGWFILIIPVLYFLLKEVMIDLRKGGSLIDSLGDSFFVAVGTSYGLGAAALWPALMLLIAVAVTLAFFYYQRKRRDRLTSTCCRETSEGL